MKGNDVVMDVKVEMGKFSDSADAHLFKIELESHGIEAFIVDDSTTEIMRVATGVRVLVFETDAEKAFEIYNNRESESHQKVGNKGHFILDLEEDDEPEPSVADDYLQRAFRSAGIGLFFLPLQIYSIYLVLRFLFAPDKLITVPRWKLFVTVLLNLYLLAFIKMFELIIHS